MALFVEHILTLSADITSIIKCKVSEWIASQATFIQALFSDISWESWVTINTKIIFNTWNILFLIIYITSLYWIVKGFSNFALEMLSFYCISSKFHTALLSFAIFLQLLPSESFFLLSPPCFFRYFKISWLCDAHAFWFSFNLWLLSMVILSYYTLYLLFRLPNTINNHLWLSYHFEHQISLVTVSFCY